MSTLSSADTFSLKNSNFQKHKGTSWMFGSGHWNGQKKQHSHVHLRVLTRPSCYGSSSCQEEQKSGLTALTPVCAAIPAHSYQPQLIISKKHHPRKQMLSVLQLIALGPSAWMLMRSPMKDLHHISRHQAKD